MVRSTQSHWVGVDSACIALAGTSAVSLTLSLFLSFPLPLSCLPSLTRFSYSALFSLSLHGVRLYSLSTRWSPVSRLCSPCPALQSCGTTKALTPASRHFGRQVSPLVSRKLPGVPTPTTCMTQMSLYTPTSAHLVCFRLRLTLAGSPPCPAESSSLYFGPPVRFRLLSTPPRGDAVTFGYGVLAYSDTDLHRAVYAPSRAH
jgi:hypothetical protein